MWAARVRRIGLMEATSYLLLIGVAMPLKYLSGMPEAVRIVGGLHGLIFTAYIAAVLMYARREAPTWEDSLEAAAASLLPLGPFLLEIAVEEPKS